MESGRGPAIWLSGTAWTVSAPLLVMAESTAAVVTFSGIEERTSQRVSRHCRKTRNEGGPGQPEALGPTEAPAGTPLSALSCSPGPSEMERNEGPYSIFLQVARWKRVDVLLRITHRGPEAPSPL